MGLLDKQINKTTPKFCYIDRDYLSYLHNNEERIRVKFNGRVFIALAIEINKNIYAVPLTTSTNKKRLENGLKPRSKLLTYEIFNGNDEIADLLFNNMFPVAKEYIKGIIIDPQKDTFLANEQRFIRKNWIDINNKAIEVYRRRYDETKLNYKFYEKLCCDFHKLEKLLSDYIQNNQEKIKK